MQFEVVKITDELAYSHVLKLRELGYRDAGKTAPKASTNYKEYLDPLISLLGFKLNGKLIATVALAFPTKDAKYKFIPESLQNSKNFSPLPETSDTVEISRLCIHENHRGTEILQFVLQNIHKEVFLSNRSHMLISTDERLKSRYKKIKFKETGITYSKIQCGKDSKLTVMSAKVKHFGIYGLEYGPIIYCINLKKFIDEEVKSGNISLTLSQRLIHGLYGSFEKIAIHLLSRRGNLRSV